MQRFQSEDYIPTGKTIGIFSLSQSRPEGAHKHDFIELVYITAGDSLQLVDGAEYQVRRGDLIFINYGATHAFVPKEGFRYINICFLPELLCEAATKENALALLSLTAFDELRQDRSGGKLTFRDAEREEVEFLLGAMLRHRQQDAPYADRIVEHYLNILLMKMLQAAAQALPESGDLWEELEQYIGDNLQESLTLEALASRCFYNPSYFSRCFKQKMGCSLSEYIRMKRMEEAKRLLTETERSIDEIASCTGYSDRTAFHHVFSRYAGISPLEFRRKEKPHSK